MLKISLNYNYHIDQCGGDLLCKSFFGSSGNNIRIDLQAYVTQNELDILQMSDNLQVYPSGPTGQYAAINFSNLQMTTAPDPMAKVISVKPVSAQPRYYHSKPLEGASQAFGKFSFSGARDQYKLKCTSCDKDLDKPEDGRIFQGSVFMAKLDDDGNPSGGLLGSKDPGSQATYCIDCTKKVLYL